MKISNDIRKRRLWSTNLEASSCQIAKGVPINRGDEDQDPVACDGVLRSLSCSPHRIVSQGAQTKAS